MKRILFKSVITLYFNCAGRLSIYFSNGKSKTKAKALKLLCLLQMAAFLNNKNNPRAPADMARVRNKFLPSIFEEKNDDKIQDFRKALKINEDEEEEVDPLAIVHSALHEAETAEESKTSTIRDQQNASRRTATARLKPLTRSFSESRMDHWRSKRQGSAFVGGSRINSGIPSGTRSFGQRKITSPGVNRARQVEVEEVIDLTNPEEVKKIARRFFQDELKMDLLDPRFDKPEDFIASLRWKAERKFSYGELWQRRMSVGAHNATLITNPATGWQQRANSNKKLHEQGQVHTYAQVNSPFLQISYSKPKALKCSAGGNSVADKKKLTTSFKQQADNCSRRRRGRILNPIRQDEKKSKNVLRYRGQIETEKKD